jgi:hypothetical protein
MVRLPAALPEVLHPDQIRWLAPSWLAITSSRWVRAPGGTVIFSPPRPKEDDPKPLARAIKRADRGRTKAAAAALDEVVPEAAEVTAKVERAVELFQGLNSESIHYFALNLREWRALRRAAEDRTARACTADGCGSEPAMPRTISR